MNSPTTVQDELGELHRLASDAARRCDALEAAFGGAAAAPPPPQLAALAAAEGRAAPYFRAEGPAPVRFAPTAGGADARAAFDKVRAETYGLEDEDCQTATPQLERTIGRELDVVQAVYNHLQWLHAPRASRRR